MIEMYSELVTGYVKLNRHYRAIIKPKISRKLNIWIYQSDNKKAVIDKAKEIAKKLEIEYAGKIELENN